MSTDYKLYASMNLYTPFRGCVGLWPNVGVNFERFGPELKKFRLDWYKKFVQMLCDRKPLQSHYDR